MQMLEHKAKPSTASSAIPSHSILQPKAPSLRVKTFRGLAWPLLTGRGSNRDAFWTKRVLSRMDAEFSSQSPLKCSNRYWGDYECSRSFFFNCNANRGRKAIRGKPPHCDSDSDSDCAMQGVPLRKFFSENYRLSPYVILQRQERNMVCLPACLP